MTGRSRDIAALVMAVCVIQGSATVRAVAAEDPREIEARALYVKGEYQPALDIYATLFAQNADPIYLRNIGRCNQKLRRPDRAIDAFQEYLRRARKLRPSEREEIEGFIREMEDLRAKMESEERDKTSPLSTGTPVETPPPPLSTATVAVEEHTLVRPADGDDGRDLRTPASGEPVPTIAAPPAVSTAQTGRFFLALAVGSGIGIATGAGELNPAHKLGADGFAPAQLGHAAPEIGVFVLRRLLLSAQLRLQYVTWVTGEHIPGAGCGGDYCLPSQLALATFGRVIWVFGDHGFHFMAGVAAGGGNIRHAEAFNDRKCGPQSTTECVDTLASGPFLFGPSLGALIELGDAFNLILGINAQVGVPKFTLNVDFNGGFAVRL